jgi:hypothetical protein
MNPLFRASTKFGATRVPAPSAGTEGAVRVLEKDGDGAMRTGIRPPSRLKNGPAQPAAFVVDTKKPVSGPAPGYGIRVRAPLYGTGRVMPNLDLPRRVPR